MRWGKGYVEPKSLVKHILWFAWYPVRLYENRYMWWEWCYAHRNRFGDWSYESLFKGKKPPGISKEL